MEAKASNLHANLLSCLQQRVPLAWQSTKLGIEAAHQLGIVYSNMVHHTDHNQCFREEAVNFVQLVDLKYFESYLL